MKIIDIYYIWGQLCQSVLMLFTLLLSIFYSINNIYKPAKSLRNKLVVITGAAQGFGFEIAKNLALKHGCEVVLLDILEKVKNATEELKEQGGNVRSYYCNVANRTLMKELAKKIENDCGRPVDIVVANAGVLGLRHIDDEDEAHMQKTFGVNVFGVLWTYQAFLPSMKARNDGHIVTTASLGSFIADQNMASYSSSKAAVRSIAETLRAELHEQHFDGIKTTIVYPFFVKTNLIKNYEVKSKYMKLQSAEETASYFVNGILYDTEQVFVPMSTEYLARLLRLVNVKAAYWFRSKLDTGFKPI